MACSSENKADGDIVKGKSDTLIYQPLPEPPPLRVDRLRTDSSEISTHYFEDLNSIREFNELDSFEVTYFKDFSFKTKLIRESGVFVGGYEKGIWSYYDSTGRLAETKDFGPWDKRMHVR